MNRTTQVSKLNIQGTRHGKKPVMNTIIYVRQLFISFPKDLNPCFFKTNGASGINHSNSLLVV